MSEESRTRGRKAIIITAVIAAICIAAFLYFFGKSILPLPKPAGKTIDVFFASHKGDLLESEKLEIPPGDVTTEAAYAINALIKGSGKGLIGVIPEGARLLSLKVESGTAVVDFSRELTANHWGGSSAELLTVYGIVNTLTLNFPEIKNVRILVEHESVETISGHIMINIPLGPDPDMIGPDMIIG